MAKLVEYKKKRDFDETSEPSGSRDISNLPRPLFVIQQHDATNLHYDFRLEVDGVLKSWAVPKGPSTDPSVKRLALETEDHPLGYGDFEGVIPEGQYGAGEVIIWDRGGFENIRDKSLPESYDEGQIEVKLSGKKLKGGYALIHTPRGDQKNQWLLVKMKDGETDARRNPTETEPKSVKSGITLSKLKKKNEERKNG